MGVKSAVLLRAVLLGIVCGGLAWLLHRSGVSLPLLTAGAIILGLVALTAPRVGVRWLDEALYRLRAAHWRREEGGHHRFGSVDLAIEDDGRQPWLAAADLQRVLRTRDRDDVIAARHSGRWRRGADKRLWLRVDAVVEHLASAPGRMDPHTVRVRRYLEREVLFPASERRRQGAPAPTGKA